jgi:hypothetical protein
MTPASAPFTDRLLVASRRLLPLIVPAWFVTISALRLKALIEFQPPGYDGMLYREATLRWLSGGDPWMAVTEGARFAAPPPTLLAMLPFAVFPGPVAVALIIGLGLLGTAWALRRLGMPLWWLAFPPLVDGLYIANPHVLVLPLLVAGAGAVAAFVKIYALPVVGLQLKFRQLALAAVLLVVTIPVLPWGQFLAAWDGVSAALRSQAAGTGLSVLAVPLLIPVAGVAAIVVGRERLAWWSVPVFWPYTQFYYASLVIPGCTLVPALIAALPVEGATTVAMIALAVEVAVTDRLRRRTAATPVETVTA